jgi:uncharacterized protein (TIGR00661 family)
MRILYGINGTGNGHITKSIQVISRLESRGHTVDTLVSGANSNLPIDKFNFRSKGFTFVYSSGRVNMIRTVLSADIRSFVKDLSIDLSHYDTVITDFEPITAWACMIRRRDCIGISHQHSFLSEKCPRPDRSSWLSEAFMRWFSPVTSHVGIHFERYSDRIYLPIIRESVANAKPTNDGHVTVYLPSHDPVQVAEQLRCLGRPLEIFCPDPPKPIGNANFMPLSLDDFTNSMKRCDIVVTAAGFETPAEALVLGKKLVVVPIEGQYEQACNAAALGRMGVKVVGSLFEVTPDSLNEVNYVWSDPIDEILDHLSL